MPRYSITQLCDLKKRREKIVCLACHTYPIAQIADNFCELMLVGDSVGMVLYGMDSTLEVDMNMMIAHGKAVTKATEKAFVVIDMPYDSYKSPEQALDNAKALIKETSAQAIKLEGGSEVAEIINYLTSNGINVVAHIGLLPQSVEKMQGFKIQGRTEESKKKLLADVIAVEKAGAFAVVIEGVTKLTSDQICQNSNIITIGIGASQNCDGQILVIDDIIGTSKYIPKFAKTYQNIRNQISNAISAYSEEVKNGTFPDETNNYN